jgi:dTDP-4-amino-4,6-dideoxygalactose transaminase
VVLTSRTAAARDTSAIHIPALTNEFAGREGGCTPVMNKLAVDGGKPIRNKAFPSWPEFLPQDVEAALTVLKSGKVNYWTGCEGRQFEQEFAAACVSKHAVAVANGTVALELALRALGVGPGDEVITPCRSYVASAGCVVVSGATPVFADVDPDSQVLTAATIQQVLTPRTKAIIAVHLAGWPCDMGPIMELAARRGLKVVEDCAQAQAAHYKALPVGSLGHAAAFSFCQDKIMTTGGEGGMLVTNDSTVWERAWKYRDHGRKLEPAAATQLTSGYRWIYDSVGTNWRLTEMQSAIGRSLLKRVVSSVQRRQQIAAKLNEAFSAIPALRLTLPPLDIEHAYYRYYAFIRPERVRDDWNRNRIAEAVNAEGIPCFSGSCPEIYREAAFAAYRPPKPFKAAQELAETSLAFLVHRTVQDSDVGDVIDAVQKVMTHASV